MNKSKQIEAMARIEFGDELIETIIHERNGIKWGEIRLKMREGDTHSPYRTESRRYADYNAVHRVLRGLSQSAADIFTAHIRFAVEESVGRVVTVGEVWQLATCAQMTEAILRACGKWEEA